MGGLVSDLAIDALVGALLFLAINALFGGPGFGPGEIGRALGFGVAIAILVSRRELLAEFRRSRRPA